MSKQLLEDVGYACRLVKRKQGIGSRLKHKFQQAGVFTSGCAGCEKTAAELNLMSVDMVEREFDRLLEDMAENVRNSTDVLVKLARNVTTEQFRQQFTKEKLLAAVQEERDEVDAIRTHLARILEQDDVPDPVTEFVLWLDSYVTGGPPVRPEEDELLP